MSTGGESAGDRCHGSWLSLLGSHTNHPQGLKIVARLTPAVTLVVFAGASCKKPPVIEIEIVPSRVMVDPHPTNPTTFELEARLWTGSPADRFSITEGDGYDNLHWKSSDPSWLTVSGNGFRAMLKVKPGASPSAPAFVTIKAGGKKTEPGAEISVTPGMVGNQDELTARYAADKPPAVVVVNGIRNGEVSCKVTFDAFVRRSLLGTVAKPCEGDDAGWGVAVLAVDHGTMFMPYGWTPTGDVLDAGTPQGSLRSIPVALHAMVGSNTLGITDLATLQDEVVMHARADVDVANSILAENRSGVQLTIQEPVEKISDPEPTVIGDCLSGDALTAGKDVDGMLNVYYVNRVGTIRGITCDRHEGRKRDVIYTSWEEQPRSKTTLLHELGHALGMMLPGAGHTEKLAGLDGTNVMATGDDDDDPVGRHRFTVGQVFRMNAEFASWLNLAMDPTDPTIPIREAAASRLACQCGEVDPAGRCPRVVDDVARPSEDPGSARSWDCLDQLRLAPMSGSADVALPADESPFAIAVGRSWRAPPGTCSPELPGRPEQRFGATYIRFDNLTRPGSCGSWVAIFFRYGPVLYQPLTEPGFTWAPTADVLELRYPASPPIDVKVHVHSPPGDLSQDIDHAVQTFGPANRSGILLKFLPAPPSCPGSNTSLEIHLCYAATGPAEATYLPGQRIIEVSLDSRTPTTVSHFLGRALGLDLATPANDPAYLWNIMQSDPLKRGQKLTLGQVFRISIPLSSTLSTACLSNACPSLTADVSP